MRSWRITTALLGVGLLCTPAFSATPAAPLAANYPNYGIQNQAPQALPGPGTLNYVEGALSLDGNPLSRNDVGNTEMAAGQVLRTHEGKAEILLNPGIYLRLDDHSAVKMLTPDITPTRVELLRGRAAVEVDQLLKQNVVQVVDHGVTTQLVKTGYYEFNANTGTVKVFKGQAEVEYANNKWAKVKGDHEMALMQDVHNREAKFHPDPAEDQLMQWSKLRSQYLAEANNQIAGEYAGAYPGWYWDPYMWDYTFLGPYGFYSPFGWGFYPMGWGPGFYGGGWYGFHGFYGGGGFHGRGGFAGGGFHGGGRR